MKAIAEGLFTDESPPRLIGGRHRESGRVVFPFPGSEDFDLVPLGSEGSLWSWTVQRYRPKSPPYAGPDDFAPWIVGYVELPGETIVEARIDGVSAESLSIGMPLTLTAVPLDPACPDQRMIPAFRPAGQS